MIKKLSLITAFCTVAASSQAANLTQKEYTKQFNEYNACFILYDVNAHKTVAGYSLITAIAGVILSYCFVCIYVI
jgi:hypothetical protein